MDNIKHLRERASQAKRWNSSRRLRIPVDPSLDPYSLPIEALNVANPELFKQQLAFKYFQRLRDEAPVALLCRESVWTLLVGDAVPRHHGCRQQS